MLSDISYVERSYLLTLARIAEAIASNRNAKREDKSKERNGCVNRQSSSQSLQRPLRKGIRADALEEDLPSHSTPA